MTTLQPIPWQVSVPFDAALLELWCHNFYEVSSRCDAWDRRFGQNYWRDPARDMVLRHGEESIDRIKDLNRGHL